jgi:hypothetical protein
MATKNLVPRNSGEGQLGTTGKAWGSGYYNELYVTGAGGWIQLTGGAGGGGSSLWSENGTKIFYNTNNVGIGTNDPGSKLEVRGDLLVKTVGEDQIALYMNNPDGNFGFVSQSGKYDQVFSSGPVKYSADTDTFLSVSGDRITIGNQQNASLTEAQNAPVGFNIIPTDAASLTTVNLISTGISFAGGNKDNLLSFIEREPLAGGIENKWTIGQVVTGLQSQPLDSGSYLVIGHNTGDSRVNLTGSDAIMVFTPSGSVEPGRDLKNNFGSPEKRWGTGYFGASTIFLGDTALKIENGALAVVSSGGVSADITGSTGYFGDLYVNGTRITGGGGAGSSLWSENGDKIYYNTDNVGIGTTNPASLLHVSGDQYQVQISGPDGQNKFIKINSSLGDNFVGFSESQNALMMLADDDAPVYIGQVSHQAIRVDKNGDRGSVVIGDDASRPAAGDEVLTVRNTGSSAGPTMTLQNNTSFGGDLGIRYEHVGIGGNSWIQGRYDSDSSFRLAYKDTADAVLGTNDIITFTTGGDVGIGTHSPTNKLEVRGDARVRTTGEDQIALYMTTPDGNVGFVAQSGEYNQVFSSGPVKYSADTDVFLSVSGDRITIGNQADIGLTEAENAPVGFNIIPTDDASLTTVNLISTGISFAGGNKDNLLNFIEREPLAGGIENKWTIGQVVTGLQSQPLDSGSYLVIGHNTGDSRVNLTGSDAIMTLSPNGNVQFNSGDITVGDTAGNNDFIVSGSKVGIALGSSLPEYSLHVSGTTDSVVAKFEGDINVGGDSADNATLLVNHTGTIGDPNAPKWENAALLITKASASATSGARVGIDNNQIIFSGGATDGGNPSNAQVSNSVGGLYLGASLTQAPYTTYNNIKIADNGVNLGSATSFSGSHTLHVSGGRTENGVLAKFEGDVEVGGDSANNATLKVLHTGTMASNNVPTWENAAFMISGANDPSGALLAMDNNQIVFSGGNVGGVPASKSAIANSHGALTLGGSLYQAPYTTYTNIQIVDNGVNLGSATSFSGSYPVHISGGRSAGGVELRVEGDISAGDSLALGTTTPYGSAIIDCTSTNKAFLPPRMTATQRDAISSPIAGMVIYNTDDNVLNFHNGTTWGAV